MPATRARERLQKMTGSDSVQLIDANYMTMLSKKYWEEYEEGLDKAEKQRMETEKNRVRRLMVQGYITPDQLHEAEHGKDDAAKRQAAKKKTKPNSEPQDQSSNVRGSSGSAPKNPPKTVSMRLSEDEQISTGHSTSTHSHDAANSEQSQSELHHNGTSSNGQSDDTQRDDQTPIENGSHGNASPQLKSTTPTAQPTTVKYTPKYTEPLLVQLYNQESVDSLYGMAEQLVPPRNKYKSDSKTSSRRVVIQ